jgi:broad specificity phosphatase PhoE
MRLIYLIRHASPVIRPDLPTREWTLSERGAREAQVLAGAALDWGIEALFSSSEAKARGTALIIGDAVGLPVNVVDAFDELRIADWVDNADAFNLVRDVGVSAAARRKRR